MRWVDNYKLNFNLSFNSESFFVFRWEKTIAESNYLEEYGRGIDIVFTKMKEWNLLSPIFKNTSNSFWVILPGKKLGQLNERQLKIWEFLMDKQSITRKDIKSVLVDNPIQTILSDLWEIAYYITQRC